MRITFLGGANEVGASCTCIEIGGRHILVDAGIQMNVDQDEKLPDVDKMEMPDAFLLTHAHTDHTGALPELVRRWPCVKGYCTPATRPITRELLKDSKKQLERKKQKTEKPFIRTDIDREVQDIDQALRYLKLMVEVPWRTPVPICKGVTARWIPAGHILGAAIILIEGEQESILITGDVSVTDQKTIPDMSMSDLPYQPDVMVMESTYGDRQHKDRAKEESQLVLEIAEVIEAGGKVLIPVFAIGRAQEVILILKQAIQRKKIECLVWVDGMARDVNDIYSKFPDEPLLSLQRKAKRGEDLFYSNAIKRVSSTKQRNSILAGPPCCLVAPSGMLKGGWSSHYAKHLVPHSENLIAITGYQAEGTPGHRLLNQRVLELDNEEPRPVACRVKRYSLSAHADRDQLIALVEEVQPRKLFLVHGESDAREKLAQSVRERCREVEVVLPTNGCMYPVKKWPGIAEGRQLPHDRILAEVSAFVRRMGLEGPFSIQELTEMWFSTKATTPIAVDFFRLGLWWDSQFFKRRSSNSFSPR